MKKIPIIHLHIPKAAGSTLTALFRQAFPPEETFLCGNNEFGLNHFQSNVYFINLEDTVKLHYRFIAGHVEFALIQSYPEKHFSFTFLRNPFSRINSMYYFIRSNSRHHLHNTVLDNNLSLEDFCEAGLWHEIDNGMCRRISGIANDIPYGKCTPDILSLAKYNLKNNISFIGIHERFNESLFLLLHSLDALELLNYDRKNTTKNKSSVAEIPEPAMKALHKFNQYDLELYSYARQLYTSRNKDILFLLRKPLAHYLSAIKSKQSTRNVSASLQSPAMKH